MRVLIVDDDVPTVRAIKTVVKWEDFGISDVDAAYDVDGARRKLGEKPFDIVLCDIEMPRASGLDLIRWARSEKIEARFIFLTCHSEFDYASQAIDYAATAYITKPIETEKIHAALAKAAASIRGEREKYGAVFGENKRISENAEDKPSDLSLDLDKVRALLLEYRGAELANYMRKLLVAANGDGRLSQTLLRKLNQDFTQVVYAVLYEYGIQANALFSDRAVEEMAENANNSIFDALKWVSHITSSAIGIIKDNTNAQSTVGRIKRFVKENLDQPLSREQIAGAVFLTPNYVSKVFREETGGGLKDYINDQRINKARELLTTTDLSVSDAAAAVGFDNFSYFSTLFKAKTGVSPRTFKER